MQNLLKKLRGNSTLPPAAQSPATDSSNTQFAQMGATENNVKQSPELNIEKGLRVETEITEVTPTEVRSKFILPGDSIEGVGVTLPQKSTAGLLVAVGDLATQEIESWEYRDGQLMADLRYVQTAQTESPSRNAALKDDIEDDRIEGIPGG